MRRTQYEDLREQVVNWKDQMNAAADEFVNELIRLESVEHDGEPETVAAPPLPTRWITPQWVASKQACEGEHRSFERAHPRGLEANLENLERARSMGWLSWFRDQLPSAAKVDLQAHEARLIAQYGAHNPRTPSEVCSICKGMSQKTIEVVRHYGAEMGLPTEAQPQDESKPPAYYVTLDWLREKRACSSGIGSFRDMFGSWARISYENVVGADGMVSWMLDQCPANVKREFHRIDDSLGRQSFSNPDRKMWRRLYLANWLMQNGHTIGLPTEASAS